MPPQIDLPMWGSQLPLPPLTGADDAGSLEDFDMFQELAMNLSFEGTLFDADILNLPECDNLDIMDDLLGSLKKEGEIRHDCMWAGTCNEHSKDRERPDPQERLNPTPVKRVDSLKDTVRGVPQTSVPQNRALKCSSQRSLLKRTNLCSVSSSDQSRTAPQEDSDDSGRPETPQSLSHSEAEPEPDDDVVDNSAELASSYQEEEEEEEEDDDDDEEDEEDDDDEEEEEEDEEEEEAGSFPVAEVTGQKVQTSSTTSSTANQLKPQQAPITTHLFNDHSYHLNKTDVSMSIPGNLTPSDSEDEIDVVSVSGEKGSCGRSASQGALPTNPSARDKHALQQSMATMATSMKRKAYSYSTYPLPGRQPSGKLARMQQLERQRERKRRAQERADSSEEDTYRPSKRRADSYDDDSYRPSKKRTKHDKYKAKRGHHSKVSSSDSEPDSCEKRSLHNNMERQRRVDLRNAFEDLRLVVPVLHTNQRAAKVVILKEASHFCNQLSMDSRALGQESSALKKERDRLLSRVSCLRKQLALQRCQR